MSGHEVIGTAMVPDGVELRLLRSGDDYAIVLERNELMSTDINASEEALATMTCERLGPCQAPQLLIGGYGMGFTLRAALAALGEDASVVVAELVPEIIEWARGPMRELTADCLDDARVLLVNDDVAMLIDAATDGYDAILLDVDNGPDGLTRELNDHLYSRHGLQAAMTALRPGGILAIWSAEPDPAFAVRLRDAGFEVTEVRVNAQTDSPADCPADCADERHVIWFARKD
ncbi:Spermine/spermidine synthase [Novosphingobium sp. CF614]|uniref:spermine/spermidine synthase domain-containing protein n=1 Tax=Novosphingobium sp. CF614 TaxID=1884364 RepID=UPI0008EA6B08|nr:spermidine synthase [Novosphingobium sp. CF614]SFF94767.1 Spermine/spermidine synthase [Novosphingobium sp. CF614]